MMGTKESVSGISAPVVLVLWVVVQRGGHFFLSYQGPFFKGSVDGDGSVIKHKDDSPPLAGSGVKRPSGDTTQPSQQHLYIKSNGNGPTNTINKAELAGILVAPQQGHTDRASDGASCLSQISQQTFNPMCMRTYLHAKLIQAISNVL
eukprot:1145339-Pelagomonas_calceolata.AAC.5